VAYETFPNCWTEKQYRYFISENSWVEVKDKMLGCRVCREVRLEWGHRKVLVLILLRSGWNIE
jgi:hypothetical protein